MKIIKILNKNQKKVKKNKKIKKNKVKKKKIITPKSILKMNFTINKLDWIFMIFHKDNNLNKIMKINYHNNKKYPILLTLTVKK